MSLKITFTEDQLSVIASDRIAKVSIAETCEKIGCSRDKYQDAVRILVDRGTIGWWKKHVNVRQWEKIDDEFLIRNQNLSHEELGQAIGRSKDAVKYRIALLRSRGALDICSAVDDTAKNRRCIKCGNDFLSKHSMNRFCSRCNVQRVYESGCSPHLLRGM